VIEIADKKTKIKVSIFILAAVIVGGLMVWQISRTTIRDTNPNKRPEQFEQVEVTGKRIKQDTNIKRGKRLTLYTHIVTFKFSDNSEKELKVGFESERIYNLLQEGETGTLTYKEIENIEQKYENEDDYYKGRLFISFEKDLNYGGGKIEPNFIEIGDLKAVLRPFGLLLIIALFMFCFVYFPRRGKKHIEFVKVIRKFIKKTKDGDVYCVTFKFSDGKMKTKRFIVRKEIYDAIRINDTGKLIYREIKTIRVHIDRPIKKKEINLRHKGRLFISFEKDME